MTDAYVQDLLNIARTTLSSKILTHDKDHFAELAVDAVLRLKGSTNLESINIIKKPGGTLRVRDLRSYASAYLATALRACLVAAVRIHRTSLTLHWSLAAQSCKLLTANSLLWTAHRCVPVVHYQKDSVKEGLRLKRACLCLVWING